MNRSRNSASLLRHKIGLAGDIYCMCDVSALIAFIISLLTQITDYWTCKIWQTVLFFLNKFYDGRRGQGTEKTWKLHTRSSSGVIQYHLIDFTGIALIFSSWWPDLVFLFCFSFFFFCLVNRLCWHFMVPIIITPSSSLFWQLYSLLTKQCWKTKVNESNSSLAQFYRVQVIQGWMSSGTPPKRVIADVDSIMQGKSTTLLSLQQKSNIARSPAIHLMWGNLRILSIKR